MRALVRMVAVAVVMVACARTAVAAGDPVPLAFKFATGDVISYDVSFSGAGKLIAPDAQVSLVTVQGSATLTQSVAQAMPDGSAVLETLLPRADVTVMIQGKRLRFAYLDGKVHWYTDGVEQTPPQADLSKAPLLQSPIRVTVRPDGAVTDVAFADQAIMDMLRKAMPGMGTAMPTMPTPKPSPILPSDPVRVGESWTQSLDLPVGEGLKATIRARRTLESVTQSGGIDVAKVTGFAETKFRSGSQSITGPGGQQLSFSVPEMKQTVNSNEFFNLGAGRLVRGDYDLAFTTKVGFAIAGANQTAGIEVRVRALVVGH